MDIAYLISLNVCILASNMNLILDHLTSEFTSSHNIIILVWPDCSIPSAYNLTLVMVRIFTYSR